MHANDFGFVAPATLTLELRPRLFLGRFRLRHGVANDFLVYFDHHAFRIFRSSLL